MSHQKFKKILITVLKILEKHNLMHVFETTMSNLNNDCVNEQLGVKTSDLDIFSNALNVVQLCESGPSCKKGLWATIAPSVRPSYI